MDKKNVGKTNRIKGGGEETATKVLMLINFNNVLYHH